MLKHTLQDVWLLVRGGEGVREQTFLQWILKVERLARVVIHPG